MYTYFASQRCEVLQVRTGRKAPPPMQSKRILCRIRREAGRTVYCLWLVRRLLRLDAMSPPILTKFTRASGKGRAGLLE